MKGTGHSPEGWHSASVKSQRPSEAFLESAEKERNRAPQPRGLNQRTHLGLLFGEVEATQLLDPQVGVTEVKYVVPQSQDAAEKNTEWNGVTSHCRSGPRAYASSHPFISPKQNGPRGSVRLWPGRQQGLSCSSVPCCEFSLP